MYIGERATPTGHYTELQRPDTIWTALAVWKKHLILYCLSNKI